MIRKFSQLNIQIHKKIQMSVYKWTSMNQSWTEVFNEVGVEGLGWTDLTRWALSPDISSGLQS